MDRTFIKVSEAARQMGRDKSSFFKLLKRADVPISLVYDDDDPTLRGQKVAVISRDRFERLLAARRTVER